VNPESIRIDVRVAWEFATCYGVNLAVAGLGVGPGYTPFFSRIGV
jgi:hypothetical protein